MRLRNKKEKGKGKVSNCKIIYAAGTVKNE